MHNRTHSPGDRNSFRNYYRKMKTAANNYSGPIGVPHCFLAIMMFKAPRNMKLISLRNSRIVLIGYLIKQHPLIYGSDKTQFAIGHRRFPICSCNECQIFLRVSILIEIPICKFCKRSTKLMNLINYFSSK